MPSKSESSLISKFDELTHKHQKIISYEAKAQIESIKTLINIENEIQSYFSGFWSPHWELRRGIKELMPLLRSLFHKNFLLFFSALDQTIKGLYGQARPLLRMIFEGLMISKFCHICNNDRILKRWDSGATVYFSNSVLKKIIDAEPKPFFDFWRILCGYSHATKFSSQVTLDIDHIREDIFLNLSFMCALLECKYHLLKLI